MENKDILSIPVTVVVNTRGKKPFLSARCEKETSDDLTVAYRSCRKTEAAMSEELKAQLSEDLKRPFALKFEYTAAAKALIASEEEKSKRYHGGGTLSAMLQAFSRF